MFSNAKMYKANSAGNSLNYELYVVVYTTKGLHQAVIKGVAGKLSIVI